MNIDALYDKAKYATYGPWSSVAGDEAYGVDDFDGNSITWDDHGGEVFSRENAYYISAANPQAIIELIDYTRDLREDVERMEILIGDGIEEMSMLQLEIGIARKVISEFITKYPDDVLSQAILSIKENS